MKGSEVSHFKSYEENDPSFEEDLRQSQVAVEVATKWLSRRGYPVIVRPLSVRPTVEEMNDYSDDGDLEILQRVEVKRRSISFTSASDYPYPTIIVDVCHTFDRASPKPFAYIIFSSDMKHAALVESRTSKSWTRSRRLDRFKKRERRFYECPVSLASFITIDI